MIEESARYAFTARHPTIDLLLEGPSLHTVTVDGHVLALQCLDDEVGHDTTIVRVHSGTEGAVWGVPRTSVEQRRADTCLWHSLEDTSDTNVDAVLTLETVG
jgi:hypothetical protein